VAGDDMTRAQRLTGIAALAAACTCLIGLALSVIVPSVLGMQVYAITGDSMTGAYDRGSLVFDRIVPTDSLRVGDVITYVPPPQAGSSGRVTHRIVAIARDAGGRRMFQTQGDHNQAPDPWRFTLGARQARVAGAVPHVGWVFGALALGWVRMLVLGGPALLLAWFAIGSLREDARRWATGGGR
jgi:signal peptidase I